MGSELCPHLPILSLGKQDGRTGATFCSQVWQMKALSSCQARMFLCSPQTHHPTPAMKPGTTARDVLLEEELVPATP